MLTPNGSTRPRSTKLPDHASAAPRSTSTRPVTVAAGCTVDARSLIRTPQAAAKLATRAEYAIWSPNETAFSNSVVGRRLMRRPQHSTKLTASPPRLVSLYFDCMSAPVWRMVAMTLSSETRWRAVAVQRQRRGGDRLDRAEGVALDAGDLHQAADRVAGHAEVMLHRDLGGVLDLLVRAAERRAQARRRHRAGDADLALAADLGARDRGVELEQRADRGRGQQEVADAAPAVAPSQWNRGSSAAPPE